MTELHSGFKLFSILKLSQLNIKIEQINKETQLMMLSNIKEKLNNYSYIYLFIYSNNFGPYDIISSVVF